MKRTLLIAAGAVLAAVVLGGLYVVDETEQVVITQFGEAVGEPVKEPGIHLRIPFVQKVNRFRKNLLEWDGEPGQVPTREKTFIWVDTFARWRIFDPLKFFEQVNNETSAHKKLDDIIDAAVRNRVTSSNLRETVRSSNRTMYFSEAYDTTKSDSSRYNIELGRAAMSEQVMDQAAPKLKEFGIELVDLRFKRINYVEEVLKNVYDRMIAERKQIAERFRSEGKGESSRIAGEKEKELKRIHSEAYREAQGIKGVADAAAADIYASAYNRDREFYSFVKTMDLYRASLDSTSWAVLSTKNDFLKYLKDYGGGN